MSLRPNTQPNPLRWCSPTNTHTHTGELSSLWMTWINHFPLTHLYSKLQRVLKLISVMTHTTQTQSPEPDNHPCNSQHAVGLHQYLLKLPQHRLVLIYITVNWAVETQYTSEHDTHTHSLTHTERHTRCTSRLSSSCSGSSCMLVTGYFNVNPADRCSAA